jgi:hypothetical protein
MDLVRGDSDVIEVLSCSFPGVTEEHHEIISLYKITNATRTPPEYKSRALGRCHSIGKFL